MTNLECAIFPIFSVFEIRITFSLVFIVLKTCLFISQVGADVGIVETLVLRNFMCHSKLEFNFNPGTNIVYGKNGSK